MRLFCLSGQVITSFGRNGRLGVILDFTMDPNKDKRKESEAPKFDEIPVRTSLEEFDPAEMFECTSCRRRTPPNRLDCIYCGAQLVLDEEKKALLKPVIRAPADDQEGFNLICFPTGKRLESGDLRSIAKMIRMDERDVKLTIESGSAVPLGRGDSEEAVKLAAQRMRESGLDVRVFTDAEVEVDSSPVRVRGLSVEGEGRVALILFNNDEVVGLSAGDVELIVVGLSLENRIEANEKHKRKGLQKVLNTTEISSDEILIDIYTRSRAEAFRIQPTGFDFSFLGDKKGLVAAVNLKLTLQFLRGFAPDAVFDESYQSIRAAIDRTWRVVESEETKSIKRKGFGKVEKTRVTTSSNLDQFTKYSRLQLLALLRSGKGDG